MAITHSVLDLNRHGRVLPRNSEAVMRQVGWIGHTKTIYGLDDEPRDSREPGGYLPLWIQIGTWEHLGDGKYGIKD